MALGKSAILGKITIELRRMSANISALEDGYLYNTEIIEISVD